MPAAIALITFGGLLVYSALHGKGIAGLLGGDTGDPLDPAGGHGGPVGGVADRFAGASAASAGAGTTVIDGKPVANWIAEILKYAKGKGWKGQVTSGLRSPAEQAAICATGKKPCGAPGKSNHQKTQYPGGAVDVTEAAQLSAILLASPYAKTLVWAGSKDPVHFSHPHNGSY